MVFAMVMIGGITRLTDSGLSIVEWRPLMGAIPPMNETEWLKVFSNYQKFPEFQKINSDMTLSEFKSIFFWEYFHRLFGRLIGMAFFFPYLYFLMRKKLDKKLNRKLIVAFVLGGMQGLMGWYMVKSGLVDRPDVSHFRLAAHLGLAFLIIGYIFWIIFSLVKKEVKLDSHPKTFKFLILFLVIISIQIIYGAFVAGLDAGLSYNTFPKMGSNWLPRSAYFSSGLFNQFFENGAMIQFIHRTIAWVLFGLSIGILFIRKSITNWIQRRSLLLVSMMVFIQFLLGVSTLVMLVPISLAVAHQLGACILLIFTLNAVHNFYPRK
jgi:cytochrome c oxidase assembly protein subunit 15